MVSTKSVLALLVLLAVSTWTTAEDLTETSNIDGEDESDLSVSEQLALANDNLGEVRNGFVVQGDIIIPPLPTLRNADPCVMHGCKWEKSHDGKVYVPYLISKEYTDQELTVIHRAMESFSKNTCIRFVPRQDHEHFIHIQSLQGCFSYVGYKPAHTNGQTLSLDRMGCIYYGTVQHELLHALGFNHEQCRSDRDRYIRIQWENIAYGMKPNFYKISTLNQGTPYDFNSVMQYRNHAFTKNGRPTMVSIKNPSQKFGDARQMNHNDISRINKLYDC